MGGHYGTIHVRTEDRGSVQSAVEKLNCENARRFLIGPPIGGWVTVFPEHNGQNPDVSHKLAAKLPEHALIHCLVHDDDVFAYWFFERGQVIDAFNSCPEYFGARNPPPRGGNAQSMRGLLVDQTKVSALQSLLDANGFDSELTRQDKFARLLGLPNTAYAYEYLQNGETEGVRQWKRFIHVPDLSAEKVARRAASAQARAELKRLQRDGILWVNEPAPKSSNPHIPTTPVWAIHPGTSEIILAWQDRFADDACTTEVRRFCADHWKGQVWDGPRLSRPGGMQFSRSGSWLAVSSWNGSQLEIWNLHERQLVQQRNFQGSIRAMAFAADESALFAVVWNHPPPAQIHRIALRPGLDDTALEDDTLHFEALSPHPDGQFLAVTDNFGLLLVIDIAAMRIVNQCWIQDTDSALGEDVRQAVISQGMDSILGALKNHMSTAELERYRRQSVRGYVPKESIRAIHFSADGHWLFCGTMRALRALAWADVLRCQDMSAVPVQCSTGAEPWALAREQLPPHARRAVAAITFDAARERVLFSDFDGTLSFLELNDGRSGELFTIPTSPALYELGLTPDRAALVAMAHQSNPKSDKARPPYFQVWNYPALCREKNLVC
jgi:hypothetical protein